MFVDKYNFSTLTGVTEVFHVCRLVYNPSTFTTVTEFFHVTSVYIPVSLWSSMFVDNLSTSTD